MSGFFVWNPAGRFPSFKHSTLPNAVTEAERLTREHPDKTFMVLAPIITDDDARRASAYSLGVEHGLAQAHREIMASEAKADRLSDRLEGLRSEAARHRNAAPILADARKYQAIVADALLWFKGFSAAFALRESYDQPHVPNINILQELNGRLQDVLPNQLTDDEIPF